MNTSLWIVVLLLLGLVTGKITGAGLAFTKGRTLYDLTAGVVGAVIVSVPLRLAGLSGYSAALPTLITGVGAAMLATWLTRIVTWPPEPALRPESDSSRPSAAQDAHDLMTTSDGTRIFITEGRLVVPAAREFVTPPTALS
jgi:uncharacterized membrane protein YeaQ/YmgE (transglycosylase-associated protein family)